MVRNCWAAASLQARSFSYCVQSGIARATTLADPFHTICITSGVLLRSCYSFCGRTALCVDFAYCASMQADIETMRGNWARLNQHLSTVPMFSLLGSAHSWLHVTTRLLGPLIPLSDVIGRDSFSSLLGSRVGITSYPAPLWLIKAFWPQG